MLNFKKSLRKGDLYNTLFNNYTYIHTKPQVWISTFPTNFIYDINFYKIYDLENIDYAHLQTLYNKKYLLEDLINLKNTNHKHDYFEGINAKNITTKYIQDLKINKKKIPAYYNFFDEKTINLVKEIYRDDFDFFEKNNFNYSLNL